MLDYILSHSEPEPEYLHALWRATHLQTLHGHMTSGHLQGRLLKMLVEMIQPQRVLEVGTFSGYSALCIAEGLPDGGHLWTYEINDEMEDFTREWLENSPYNDRITFMIGDAIREAPKLDIIFDMAFIDGDKRSYVETYEAVLPIVKNGGFLLADNTLWDGHVTDSAYDRDRQTQGIRRFNDHVAVDPRTKQVILPIRDGLTIIKKICNGN
jgi:predicted O-methyltransferase YrrM